MTQTSGQTAAWLASTLMVLLLCGCATGPKVDPNIDWNSRVGNYTFDQAVAELGRPDAVAESGEGRIVDWVLKRSPNVSFGFGVGHSVYGPHVGSGVGVGTTVAPPPHGEYLRLVFDPQNKLKAWNRTRN